MSERLHRIADQLEDAASAIDSLELGDVDHSEGGKLRSLRNDLEVWADSMHTEAQADE